jgi:parvulin-like peptidyl-prolyl isomerase
MQFRPYVACAVLAGAFCFRALAADAAVVEEIIAKVNGDIITRGELDRDRKMLEQELAQRAGLKGPELRQQVDERSKDLLRERIDGILLVSKGKELSINVDSEISKYFADLRNQSKIVEDEKFQQWIRENTGMTFEDYKNEVRNGMLKQRVIREQVGRSINIPRAEVQKYYDEHKNEFVREERIFLREIVLALDGKSAAEQAAVEKKAKDLVARARKGERFGDLAKANSDSATKEQYGELGGFKKGELDRTIEGMIWDKERGYVTDPIRRSNAIVILRVEDHQKEGQASLEEVENEVMEKLYTPRFQPKIREYLTQLRKEAFLEIKEGYTDSGAADGKDTRWVDPAQLKPETVTKEEVAGKARRKRLLWMVPIPGTGKSSQDAGVSTSK